MNDEPAFLQAMQKHPDDATLRLVFADWLEEQGDRRAELLRLLHTLTQSVEVPKRSKLEYRLRSLVASGVKPIGPFWTNSIGMKFAWIPAGAFLMGSPGKEKGRHRKETQHQVTLTRGYWLANHPVTQACWRAVLGNNPSYRQGDDLPVETVSWNSCQDFLQKISERDGYSYRLPTEAEWEYACRAGTTTSYHFGTTISTAQANFGGSKTSVVGSYPPNPFGLYDMHGNVWEWCADGYEAYPEQAAVDPTGAEIGPARVLRGGSFFAQASKVRSAYRLTDEPASPGPVYGFRPARTVTP